MIFPIDKPMKEDAGFIVLKGNLFNNAVMKTSVIGEEFRARYLSNPKDPDAFEGRAIVFDGPEDYHHRIDDPALKIDEHCMLFIRGTGPIGYPGGAEVVNMQPPAYLIKQGVHALPCIGDGRQSGTSGSPSILNASPEAAAGGGLALLKTGDRVRIDLQQAHRRHPDQRGRTRRAPRRVGGAPLRLPAQPDALAGDPALDGGAVRRGHGAEAGGRRSRSSRRRRACRATTTDEDRSRAGDSKGLRAFFCPLRRKGPGDLAGAIGAVAIERAVDLPRRGMGADPEPDGDGRPLEAADDETSRVAAPARRGARAHELRPATGRGRLLEGGHEGSIGRFLFFRKGIVLSAVSPKLRSVPPRRATRPAAS